MVLLACTLVKVYSLSMANTNYRDGRYVINGRTDGRNRQWADSLKLETVADIKKLPWLGNHYSDSELFHLVDRFVRRQTDRAVQKAALAAVAKYGMGIDAPVKDVDLDLYLSH